MVGAVGGAGMNLQRQMSEFLYAELLHSLGAYRGACTRMDSLLGELEEAESGLDGVAERRLRGAAQAARHCNAHLRDQLHHPASADGSILRGQPSPFPVAEKWAYPTASLLTSISDFYEDAAAALRLHLTDLELGESLDAPDGFVLGYRLAFIHDPHRRRAKLGSEHERRLVEGKIERVEARLAGVRKLVPDAQKDDRAEVDEDERNARFAKLLRGDASKDYSLLLTIIQAMSEAHMWMHEAEHEQSQSFGEMLGNIPETHLQTHDMLRYSRALNSFVYAAARTAPWIFAEDETERKYVIANYPTCVTTLAPTYCMWISVQFSLLALHRRAFTWWSMGRQERAYRDFHKLIRLLRGLRGPADRRGLRVPGTKTFIAGITGMSELHIGRIYRGQHAHKMALRYFERASGHLEGWEKHGEIGDLIKSSHWRLNLLLNEGKAHYQLGHVKRSLLCYAKAWRAYLLLVEAETHATANLEVVNTFTEWMEKIVGDPDLNRRELRTRIEPLVEQFGTLRAPPQLRLLAADIVMRVGHLLLVLKLPPANEGAEDEKGKESPRALPPQSDHDLAGRCMSKAAFLDPTSTMAAADLLRIEQAIDGRVPRPDEAGEAPAEIALADQWPAVSGRFEEAAQATEYVLQHWLKETEPKMPARLPKRKRIARELLNAFLAHTDSSNVKLAQVYRYLTQGKREPEDELPEDGYALDFVCMRRYSSFFPFLPRPSAFRAPGGGYFVHVREHGKKPFGIAIDPGPDFIENLYRCGYALVDIQMIIVTHDHADHIASLDALLALMFNREELSDKTFDQKRKRLAIIANKSAFERYEFFNEKKLEFEGMYRKDSVRVLKFDEMADITNPENSRQEREKKIKKQGILFEPETLRIEPVRTWGHIDAAGRISQGFLLSFGPPGDRASILFTGDTGSPKSLALEPDPEREERAELYAKEGSKELRTAIEEADVVVAHLSSVPLRELRILAGLKGSPKKPKPTGEGDGKEEVDLGSEYVELWERAAKQVITTGEGGVGVEPGSKDPGIEEAEFLLKQIQFGFRVKSEPKALGVAVSPFSHHRNIRKQSSQHLYLSGLIEVAEAMAAGDREQLLLIGELREELGTFRTSIAGSISDTFFKRPGSGQEPSKLSALTTDIGLRVRLTRTLSGKERALDVLCTTCDLDNDLVPSEQFHRLSEIREVCVKGEDEGVFYNCLLHDPRLRDEYLWVESVERYDVFGE